ncbi:hypothetical protein BKA61DRAFT_683084 [Leptodontidium sp. MPI-SDFR-AT-0119]|nr:hypothetical protein BKA61DRAFT_683084 [Leptodontidium sp. MPI-SDFR-AT-0119]
MYSTAALEEVLLSKHTPLLHFAATKDFIAENILFLVAPEVKRMLWVEAVEIYAYGVIERYADFPVNIEGRLRKTLD